MFALLYHVGLSWLVFDETIKDLVKSYVQEHTGENHWFSQAGVDLPSTCARMKPSFFEKLRLAAEVDKVLICSKYSQPPTENGLVSINNALTFLYWWYCNFSIFGTKQLAAVKFVIDKHLSVLTEWIKQKLKEKES